MEVPRLGVEYQLQLPACVTATATPDVSCIYDLCHSLWQCQILNPLREARDWTGMLIDTSQVFNPLSHLAFWHLVEKNNCGMILNWKKICLFVCLFIYLFILSFVFLKAAPMAYGRSQARGQIGAISSSLLHSPSNARSKPHLLATPQITATLDP